MWFLCTHHITAESWRGCEHLLIEVVGGGPTCRWKMVTCVDNESCDAQDNEDDKQYKS